MKVRRFDVMLVCILGSFACAPDSSGGDAGLDDAGIDPGAVPTSYAFKSRFGDESSVAYSGQVQRQLHLAELKKHIANLSDTQYVGSAAEDVIADLAFFFDYKNAGGSGADSITLGLGGGAEWKQATFGDVGSPASLREKMPDQDLGWTTGVVGVGDGTLLPTAVVDGWFAELAELVIARANGSLPQDPSGNDIEKPYLSADGRDLAELIQKYLGGAVAFSQGAGDYLADGPEGKGLSSDNVAQAEGKPYTALEHHWDEGFGYFGASRDYSAYTDDEIAGAGGRDDYRYGFHDTDGDGFIDATSEYVFGHAQNAGKRDRGSDETAKTDFSKDAFDAFLSGRHLISSAEGALTQVELTSLKAHRDAAISAWEKAIAASAVHYVNELLGDMEKFGVACDGTNADACYDFATHAKHFSELKGFALSLQFNPRSPLSAADLAELHELIGEVPVLPTAAAADISAYESALLSARDLLGDVYGFDEVNVSGW